MIRPVLLALLLGAPASAEVVEEIRVHGNLEIATEKVLEIAGIAEGDRLYWFSCGAYCSSYCSQNFNGFPPLKVYVI